MARLIVPETKIEEKTVVSQTIPSQKTRSLEESQVAERSTSGGQRATPGGQRTSATTTPSTPGSPGGTGGGRQQPTQPSDDVGSVGVLALLGTTSSHGRDDRVADILGEAGNAYQDFDQLFSSVDRITSEGESSRGKGSGSGKGRQLRGSRTTTDENLDQLLSGLGDAKSTSLTRSNDLITIEMSPLTQEGVGEGEDGEGGGVIVGARDPEKVSRIVNAHKAALQYCYQRELKRNPNLRGKIVVRFTITYKGNVKNVKILSSTLDTEHVERCILSRIRRWDDFGEIPKDLGNATFRQVYSFGY